jgi:hypothetical protein
MCYLAILITMTKFLTEKPLREKGFILLLVWEVLVHGGGGGMMDRDVREDRKESRAVTRVNQGNLGSSWTFPSDILPPTRPHLAQFHHFLLAKFWIHQWTKPFIRLEPSSHIYPEEWLTDFLGFSHLNQVDKINHHTLHVVFTCVCDHDKPVTTLHWVMKAK